MTSLDRASVQEMLDAADAGDYGPVFDSFAENIIVKNGPGAGPWSYAEGRDDFADLLLEFSTFFNGTFRQRGRCLYADERVVISLIEESGVSPRGDTFENLAVYVTRVDVDGKGDRLWTVDLDTEVCLEFWARNPVGSTPESLGGPNEPPVKRKGDDPMSDVRMTTPRLRSGDSREAEASDLRLRRWVGVGGLAFVVVLLATVFATPNGPDTTARRPRWPLSRIRTEAVCI